MMPGNVAMRAMWLFTNRSGETVRLVVRNDESSYELLIAGPAHARTSCRFDDAILLIQYQSTIEAQLVEQGYTLEHFVTDRRSGRDRRTYPRRIDRERRRG